LAGVRAAERAVPHTDATAEAGTVELGDRGPDARAEDADEVITLRRLVSSERALQVLLLVLVVGNLGMGGVIEVGLPALAHGPLHAGASGYGALIATFGAGALLGTLAAGQLRALERPAIVSSLAILAEAPALAAVPYLGGTVAAGAALLLFGALNGFGNLVMITTIQLWAPSQVLGRITGLVLVAGFGVFPVSVAVAGIVVQSLGPAPLFIFAGVTTAIAILVALSQHQWRDFGSRPPRTGQSSRATLRAASTRLSSSELR
jgi:predicted MFS family arabinose efflux permease